MLLHVYVLQTGGYTFVAPDFDYLSKYWVAKLAKDDA